MGKNMMVRWVSVAVAIVLVVAAGVFLLSRRSNEAPGSVRQYPELEPGEKVPNSMFGNLGFPGPPPQFEFEGPFPQIPEKMLIYKIIPAKEFTPADARQLAQKYFNVPPDAEFYELSIYYSLKTRTHVFYLHPKTGFFSFDKLEEAIEKHSKDRKDFPSDDECIRIATEYFESRGLLPDGAVFGGVTDNTSCGRMSVGFGRLINGYRSWGVGTSIGVELGPGGEVVSASRHWLEIEPWKLAPIKTPQEAFAELGKGNAYYLYPDDGRIEDITLRYNTQAYTCGYVEPIYFFTTYLRAEGESHVVLPAVRAQHVMSDEEMEQEIERRSRQPSGTEP